MATLDLTADTLTGDIRDFILQWIRSMKKPLEQMSEQQQLDVVEAVEKAARELVGGAIQVVAGQGFPRAYVRLGAFTVKDGVEAKIVSERTDRNLLNFNAFAGKGAVLIFADRDEFDGQRGAAKIIKQQVDIEDAIAEKTSTEAAAEMWAAEPHDPETGEMLDAGPIPSGLVRNPNPAKPGTIDPFDPGEPETVTVNDAAPIIQSGSSDEPFTDDVNE